jgi:serine protease Do
MKKRSKLLTSSIAALLVGGGFWLAWPVFQANANPLQELREREAKVKKTAADSLESVVALTAQDGTGAGSGVIVSESGLIMTASHVVDALGDKFTVTFHDGREVSAKALGAHRTFDAALAQITTAGAYPFVSMADGVAVGDWCVAMGHPGGPKAGRTPPVRLGRIWKQGERSKFLTSDCMVSGGDSGGPLFNLEGEVIGIHSSISPNANYNRHVPVTVFQEDWERMIKGESWGRLGTAALLDDDFARAVPGNSALLGVLLEDTKATVGEVAPLSAADAAGIRAGDVIIAFDGTPVDSTRTLQHLVRAKKPGDKVTVTILRNGSEKTLNTTLTGRI